MQVITVKDAWIASIQIFLVLFFQSGLSTSCLSPRLLLQLTPCSCIGIDSVQTITTPETRTHASTIEIDVGGYSLG
jgi:hypothetical protein